MMEQWKPYEGRAFDYSNGKLEENWTKIHAGNLEPFPADEGLQDVWRAYHEGRFQDAMEQGKSIGGAGLVPAAFATTIYAQYLEDDEKRKVDLLLMGIDLAKQATEQCPDSPNAFYMLAVSYGRHSQFINMIEALQQGVAPKINNAISRCLELEPGHAEGQAPLAGWHAEIVDKVGAMLAGLAYGAKKDQGEEHYKKALELAPKSPVPYIEKAQGMILMLGEMVRTEVMELLQKAQTLEPMDAMQVLDVAKAGKLIEELPGMEL